MSAFFGDIFGDADGAQQPPRPEKGVPLRGKDIDGVFYVRVDDVVALLELNKVLPKAAGLLKTRCQR